MGNCKKRSSLIDLMKNTNDSRLMNKCRLSSLGLFLGLQLLVFASLCCTNEAVATAPPTLNFADCLSAPNNAQIKPIPKGDVSKIVYQQNNANPTFTSVLDDYVRNLRYNTTSTPKPAMIVTPLTEDQVPAVVVCAKASGIEMRIRSGGHDYEGVSYVSYAKTFMILDMFNLRSVDVTIDQKGAGSAWVKAGAYLGELYYRISEKSRVHGFPAGVCPTVAVGGHLSGAGYGNMLRQYGVSVDHVVDARIVNANGEILDRKGMGDDLFWAIRGGGGASFGVILAYKIELVAVPEKVTYFRVEKMVEENGTAVVIEFQKAVRSMDSRLFVRLLVQPSTTANKNKTVKITAIALFLGNKIEAVKEAKKELPSLGLNETECVEMSWIESVVKWANFKDNAAEPQDLLSRVPEDPIKYGKRKSDYVETAIPEEGLRTLWNKIQGGEVGMVFNSYGGKLTETSDNATAFPHRSNTLFKIQYSVSWENGTDTEANLKQAKDLYQFMTPYVANPRRAYLNYRDLDIGTNQKQQSDVFGSMYFRDNFKKLVQIKKQVDPQNFFRYEQSIPLSATH
ncbi:unnamed protein product [Cuscuta europaea]|uniref:FAD-binding PCMH-type domain-containing protein n=1 Tax=Cuscuta europaea TaxID=41803 RepID=A0A9P0ZPB2_CUSEU|nr:unnamed protein product [Cuscuta europaea]